MDKLTEDWGPQDGPVTDEVALAAAGTHNGEGTEVSDDQRQYNAERIAEAARANASWRGGQLAASIPVGDAVRLMTEPVIFVPEPVDDPDPEPDSIDGTATEEPSGLTAGAQPAAQEPAPSASAQESAPSTDRTQPAQGGVPQPGNAPAGEEANRQ